MDWPRTILVFLAILVTQCSNHMVRCKITDVRLVGGPSSIKGTVELRQDSGTWETTCGTNLGISDVIVICRQLGFTGASRAIPNTPYGQNSTPAKGLQCNNGVVELSECTVFTSTSCSAAGAASCHGEGYLGCFVDFMNDRVLPGDDLIEDPSMTISKCIQFCIESITAIYRYAGVVNGKECFCGEAGVNYARLGIGTDSDCQSPCSGESIESCGGVAYVAVFSAPVQSSAPSGYTSTEDVMTTNNGSKPTISTSALMSTTPRALSALPQRGNDTGLYGGIGGGVAAFIIIVVIIVTISVFSRRSRNRRKDASSQGMTLATSSRPLSINGHGVTNAAMAMEETSATGASPRAYHTPENAVASAPAPRKDKSGLVVNLNPKKSMNVYEGISDDVQGDELMPYASVNNCSAVDERIMPKKNDRLSVVYAMPDKNENGTRNSFKGIADDVQSDEIEPYASVDNFGKKLAHTMPEMNDRLSVVYAMPDKNGNGTSEDVGFLYAMPDVSRGEPDGQDEGSSRGLYALPDKSLSGDQYKSGMVENELYTM